MMVDCWISFLLLFLCDNLLYVVMVADTIYPRLTLYAQRVSCLSFLSAGISFNTTTYGLFCCLLKPVLAGLFCNTSSQIKNSFRHLMLVFAM